MKNIKYLGLCILLLVAGSATAQNIPTGATAPAYPTFGFQVPYSYQPGILVNHVRSEAILIPVTDTNDLATISGKDKATVTVYTDGLGRTIQSVSKHSLAQPNDIVAPAFYDSFGRQQINLLPYESNTNTGNFKLDPFLRQYFDNMSKYPDERTFYSQVVYDDTSLYRSSKTMQAGSSYAGANKGTTTRVMLSKQSENVRMWDYNSSGIPTTSAAWTDNMLYVSETIDAEGKRTRSYKDREGKQVLTKVEVSSTAAGTQHTGWLCTYYVYDELNHLRHIITPKVIDSVQGSGFALTQNIMDELCYSYTYDYKGRITEKKLPGQAKIYIMYDAVDRPVLIQDGNLRATNDWLFTKYDGLGRVIASGKFLNSSNLSGTTLTTELANTGTSSYAFINFLKAVVNVNTYTTTSSISDAELYSINYFDNYDNTPSGFGYNDAAVQNLPSGYNSVTHVKTGETMGMATGGYARVMDGNSVTSQWLSSVSWFDTYGSMIQSQSVNHQGGHDTVSMRYSFAGPVQASFTSLNNPGANDTAKVPAVHIAKVFIYDDRNRLLQTGMKINDEPYYRLVNKFWYDGLGRVKTRNLGANAEQQDYTYRPWGALESINKDFCVNNNGNHFFGELIHYDYGFSNITHTGMPSGLLWRMKGSAQKARAYGYTYDAAGRLAGADYNDGGGYVAGGTVWSHATEDYTAKMQYDGNGNMMRMDQWGNSVISNGPLKIDRLTYRYVNNGMSNRLQAVDDSVTQYYGLGEFREQGGPATTDYSYDDNGNAATDVNRNITSISYNYQNKPYQINFTNNRSIKMVYDAAGSLLRKQISEGGNVTHTIDYLGGLEYKDSTLQSIPQEEGRVRPVVLNTPAGRKMYYEYDFFVKDHSGNIRSLVTEEPDSNWMQPIIDQQSHLTGFTVTSYSPGAATGASGNPFAVGMRTYTVGSELANAAMERSMFSNVDSTRADKLESVDPNDVKATQLNADNGQIIGPAIMLRVMAGDKISANTGAYYEAGGDYTSNATPEQLANSLMTALSGGGQYIAINESGLDPNLVGGGITNSDIISAIQDLKNRNTGDGTKPQAFLNYILLDDNLQVSDVESGFVQTTEPDSWNTLNVPEMEMTRNGYMIVFLSNESKMNVQFDNLTIHHYKGKLQEENHYYPYGLTVTTKAVNGLVGNDKLYAGKQLNKQEFSDGTGLDWYNFGARQYDQQIGMWHSADPLAEEATSLTPYHFCNNNPVVFSDPTGMRVMPKDPPDATTMDLGWGAWNGIDDGGLNRMNGGGGGGFGVNGALAWLTTATGGQHGTALGGTVWDYVAKQQAKEDAVRENGNQTVENILAGVMSMAHGDVSNFYNDGNGQWGIRTNAGNYTISKNGVTAGFYYGWNSDGTPISDAEGKNGTFEMITFDSDKSIRKGENVNQDNESFWPHLIAPIAAITALPLPKNWFGPVLRNSSKYTSLLSASLGRWKKPINFFGKTRLYTHTLNGSRRYASTWGRYLGRWSTRIVGEVSAWYMVYDAIDSDIKLYKSEVTDVTDLNEREDMLNAGGLAF